jgi:hypothetical protein
MYDEALQPATMHHIVMVADAPPEPTWDLESEDAVAGDPPVEIGQPTTPEVVERPIPEEVAPAAKADDEDWSLQALAEALTRAE